ncbi:hypothetical protein Goshw_013211 [Gossypium schwendimanii]|uniref:Uncharacterized protein n=1 Tax=Gossypium schwendimanii TaxID=34291 RepID=A0A7J9N6B0_GOSSC|nr:hypothetical protein [Gossypium schwendimanii]
MWMKQSPIYLTDLIRRLHRFKLTRFRIEFSPKIIRH